MRKHALLPLLLGIGLASLVWGKAPRLEIGLTPSLAIFGDAVGGVLGSMSIILSFTCGVSPGQ